MQYVARTLWTNLNTTQDVRLLGKDSVCYLPTNAHKIIEISLYTMTTYISIVAPYISYNNLISTPTNARI